MSSTDGKIPQDVRQSKSTPQHGEPYNYSKVLDTIMVPQVVVVDQTISPGARLLWGVIRRFGYKGGRCFATDETLARALAVSARHVRRYCAELVKAGLLRETPTRGKPTRRELLWDSRFDGEENGNTTASPSPIEQKANISDPGHTTQAGQIRPPTPDISVHPPRTYPSTLSKNARARGFLRGEGLSDRRPLKVSSNSEKISTGKTTTNLERSAAPDGLAAGAAPSASRPPVKLRPPATTAPANNSGVTARDRTPEQLAKYLRFQYLTTMDTEPELELLNSLVKILRARQADHIAYCLEMRDIVRHLKEPARPAIWLKTALAAAVALGVDDLANP